MSDGSGTGRRIVVVDLADPSADPAASGADVAVVVLRHADQPDRRELLARLRGEVQVVMGIVLSGDGRDAGGALATLREFADIVAHAGSDVEVVDDVTATLAGDRPTRATATAAAPSQSNGGETWTR